MNISREETGELTSTIQISLTREDYEEKVTKSLKEQQRNARLPGFRPGKVPFGMIRKMYGKAVLLDEINNLLAENLNHYISENNLRIIGNPLPNKEKSGQVDLDHQEEFDFYFDIGIAPEVDLELSDKTSATYYDIKADDTLVEKNIHDLLHRYGSHSHPEEVADKDVVQGELVELDGEGKPVENGIRNKTAIALDLVKNDKEKTKFLGSKKDETIRFNPQKAFDDPAELGYILGVKKEQAEKVDSDFDFTISEITRNEHAEMGEEFYKQVFPEDEIKNEKEFRARLKKALEDSMVKESDRYFMNGVIEQLVENTRIPLPDEFIKRWLEENNEEEVDQGKVEEQYDNFSKSLRWQLIESKLVRDHDLRVQDGEMRDVVRNYFTGQVPMPEQDEEASKRLNGIIDSVLSNKEEAGKIHDQLFDQKLLTLFKDKIKIKHKDIDYDDFVKKVTKENK